MKVTEKCFWCSARDFEYVAKRSDEIDVIACKKCDLIQVAKSPESLEDYYTENYYNPGQEIEAIGYDDYYTLINPLFLLWQSELLGAITDKTKTYSLLDVGCATGNLMEIINLYHSNIQTTGIDISQYAVDHCIKKGLKADQAYIEKYKSKSDIIISLETLEHLDNLKVFIEGIERNLATKGSFLFYVPSVARHELEDTAQMDVRLSTNLEHLIYFTPEFFSKQFLAFFGKKVYVQEIVTRYGRSIVGLVTEDQKVGRKFTDLFMHLSNSAPVNSGIKFSDSYLKNLVVVSAKFFEEKTTHAYLKMYESRKTVPATDKEYARAVIDYHNGNLASSIKQLLHYYTQNPADIIALKILLSNESTYNDILLKEIGELTTKNEQQKSHPTTIDAVEKSVKIARHLARRVREKINSRQYFR